MGVPESNCEAPTSKTFPLSICCPKSVGSSLFRVYPVDGSLISKRDGESFLCRSSIAPIIPYPTHRPNQTNGAFSHQKETPCSRVLNLNLSFVPSDLEPRKRLAKAGILKVRHEFCLYYFCPLLGGVSCTDRNLR